jgi:hypothetical protein
MGIFHPILTFLDAYTKAVGVWDSFAQESIIWLLL